MALHLPIIPKASKGRFAAQKYIKHINYILKTNDMKE